MTGIPLVRGCGDASRSGRLVNSDQWDRLSEWHGAWLDADADSRLRLRAQLAATHPDLIAVADDLVADSSELNEFLETPAFVLAAQRMAQETASVAPGAQVGPYRV